MKTLLSIILLAFIFAGSSFAQEFNPPPAIDNEFANESIGSWVSEEYELMGMKWKEESTINWVLNKQFLEMKSVSTSDKGVKYESIGYMTVDAEGNLKAWFFDIWGMEGVGIYTGKVDGLTGTMEGENDFMKSKSTMVIENGVFKHNMSFTYPDEEGNEVTMDVEIISYKQ